MEDYLKNILILEQDNRVARVSDISRRMNVKKASVVSAVNLLKEAGLLLQEKYAYITLTDAGRKAGNTIKKKYDALYSLFTGPLGLSTVDAAEQACGAEHSLSDDTVYKLKALAKSARSAERSKKAAAKKKKK
jgi:DtxR family Mn-dependent transcriptional regulator